MQMLLRDGEDRLVLDLFELYLARYPNNALSGATQGKGTWCCPVTCDTFGLTCVLYWVTAVAARARRNIAGGHKDGSRAAPAPPLPPLPPKVFSPPLQALARLGDRETLLKLLLHEMPLRLGGHATAPAPRRAKATTTNTVTADDSEDTNTPEESDEQQPSPRREAPPTARRAKAKAPVPPHAPSFVVAMGALREVQPALGAELFFMYVDATGGNSAGSSGASNDGGHNGANGGSGGGPLHPALVDAALQVRLSVHLL
jgi:hypothetical protein